MSKVNERDILKSIVQLEKEIAELKKKGGAANSKELKQKQAAYRIINDQYEALVKSRESTKEQIQDLSSISNYNNDVYESLVEQESSYNSLYGISGLLKENAQQIVQEQKNYANITGDIIKNNEDLSNVIDEMVGSYSNIANQSKNASDEEKRKFELAKEISTFQSSLKTAETKEERDAILEHLKGRLEEFDNLNKSAVDYVSKLTDVNDSISNMQKLEFVDPNIIPTLAQINDLSVQLADLSEEDAIQREVVLDKINKLKTSLTGMAGIQDKTLKTVDAQVKQAEYLGSLSERQRDQLEAQLEAYENLKNMFGGIADTIAVLRSGFLSAVGQIAIGFGIALDKIGEINKELGMSLLDVGELQLSAVGLGLVFKDANNAAIELANTFGTMPTTFDLQLQTNILSETLGTSTQETVALTKAFAMLNDGSTAVAADMMVSVRETAKMSGVIPTSVMKDLAKNTEMFALHAKDGGKNIAEAAIYASQLGVELDTLSQVTESLLDYDTSITKELELSAMLGRNINLNRARALAYEDDIQGAVAETLNQLGGIEAFNQMDKYAKKEAADLLGISVGELQKMADNQAALTEDVGLLQKGYSTFTESVTALGNTFAGTVMQGAGGFLITLGQINMGITAMGFNLTAMLKRMGAWILWPFKAIGGWIIKTAAIIGNTVATVANTIATKAWSAATLLASTIMNSSILLWAREKLLLAGSTLLKWGNIAATYAWNAATSLSNSLKSTAIGKWILEKVLLAGNTLLKWANAAATWAVSGANTALAGSQTAVSTTAGPASGGIAAFGASLAAFGTTVAPVIGVLLGLALAVLMITPALYVLGQIVISIAQIVGGVFIKALEMLPEIISSISTSITSIVDTITNSLIKLSEIDATSFLGLAGGIIAIGAAVGALGVMLPVIMAGVGSLFILNTVLPTFASALSQLSSVDGNSLASLGMGMLAVGSAIGSLGLMLPAIILGVASLGILSKVLPMLEGLGQTLSTLSNIDGQSLTMVSLGMWMLFSTIGMLGMLLPAIILGSVAIATLSLVVPTLTNALAGLASINGENLSVIGDALIKIGQASLMIGAGIALAVVGILTFVPVIPILYLVSTALSAFAAAMLFAGLGGSMLATSLPIISQSIQQMVEYVGGILALSDAILKLSASLTTLSFSSILAAPAMLAISLFGKQTAEAAPANEGGGAEVESFSMLEQAIRETNEMLISEIKGLREDLNSGKISVNMDGDSVTSKIVRNINRSATNAYGLKG